MKFISRRGLLTGIAAGLVAPLAAKARAAVGWGRRGETRKVMDTKGADGGQEGAADFATGWSYDECARPVPVCEPGGACERTTTYCYDETGRLLSVVEPWQGEETTFMYRGVG